MTNRVGQKRSGRKWMAAAAVAVAGLAAGCTGTETISDPGPPGAISIDDVRLVAFDSCDGLLDWFHTEAVARVGPYGLEGSGMTYAEDSLATGDSRGTMAASSASDKAAPSAAPGETSTTNTQEAGIGEPDLAWTDGRQLVTVVNGSLEVVDLDAGDVTARIDLQNADGARTPVGLLVDGAHVVVIQHSYDTRPMAAGDGIRGGMSTSSPATILTRVDLGTEPAIVGEVAVDGDYVDARLVDGVVRTVVRTSPQQLGFVYPSGGSEASVRRAEEANREIIEESSIEDWMPSMTVTADGQAGESKSAVDCGAVEHPTAFGGFDMVTVVGLDLGAGAVDPLPSAAVVAGAGTVYASADHLYVTTTRYPEISSPDGSGTSTPTTAPESPGEVHTGIHAFSLPADVAARYEASGSVPGQLIDQFALSEHEGDLRVATTTQPNSWWSGPTPVLEEGNTTSASAPAAAVSESRVTVLRRADTELRTVGQITGLGPTEQIQGVRFAGPQAYVVTFRQTDPLYVVDLSDPTDPRVAGELKIPGYSSYLQVIGEGRVLGLGQDATDTGRATGFQESLFDVSDPAAPNRLAQLVVPASQSLAESDHHAVLWWESDRLLAVPFTRWGSDSPVGATAGVLVTHVDDAGIVEVGTITHPDTGSGGGGSSACPPNAFCAMPIEPGPGYGGGYPTEILRTLVANGQLVTVSTAGVKVSDLTTLADIAWIPLV